jgi:hypothetical protein
MPSPTRPRTPNRPATEAALQAAALDLLERNGARHVSASMTRRPPSTRAGATWK